MTRIIECEIRFYNSDKNALNEEDRNITEIIYENKGMLNELDSYDEKLKVWSDIGLVSKTAHWIGDFSKITSNFGRYSYPDPIAYVSIYPENFSQLIKFNLFNLGIAISDIGAIDTYMLDYLQSIHSEEYNPLIEVKIRKDLKELKNNVHKRDFFKSALQKWYESFSNAQDTLNESHYSLFKNNTVTEFSNIGFGYDAPPYLCYLLNERKYVFEAAEGYLLSKKIPFLEEILKTYDLPEGAEILLSPSASTVTKDDEVDSQQKKSRKKAKQITLKQQLILLHKLGMPAIIDKLNNGHKAAILSQLFLRNEQDVRSMLTYWGNVNAPIKYNTTLPDDLEKIIDLLEDNNIQS